MIDVVLMLFRFVLRVPMATSPPITFHVSHPDPSNFVRERNQREVLEEFVRERNQNFHSAETGMRLQFPETRLIQYDCGKSLCYTQLYIYGHYGILYTSTTCITIIASTHVVLIIIACSSYSICLSCV